MSDDGEFSASLILKGGGARVGLERIALLEAVASLGAISAAAKAVGLSYKGAWDGVQALNNLFDEPLVIAAPGGRGGGAAEVTPHGQAVIRAFRTAERELGAAFARLEGGLLWTLGLRTSARNALRGVVAAIDGDGVTAGVTLSLAEDLRLRASITRRSVEDLALAPGRPAIALIKSSFVRLGEGDGENRLPGEVVDREAGEASAEVTLALSAGKTLVATARPGDPGWALAVGDRVEARIAADEVILAVD
ncbi:TOBE domain-containing protein [uncultured Caulobacter sp.]|uniref:TOBE domain-containing protein n=1 Tax=uncultured Caulobacter sp. TaxID=158749 RepID=UPI0026156988|nr:TOBE domain-containing protein [uncultured Caulobacter sp.]